jgi:hypothetical protein
MGGLLTLGQDEFHGRTPARRVRLSLFSLLHKSRRIRGEPHVNGNVIRRLCRVDVRLPR